MRLAALLLIFNITTSMQSLLRLMDYAVELKYYHKFTLYTPAHNNRTDVIYQSIPLLLPQPLLLSLLLLPHHFPNLP